MDYKIEQVKAIILNANGTTIKESPVWDCSAHGGQISGIAPQSGCTLIVQAFIADVMVWAGQRQGISIANGKTTTIDPPVEMLYLGGDIEPPVIETTSPADLAESASLDGSITATFDKDMAPNSINTETFLLTSTSTPITGQVSYDSTSRTATFTPDTQLGLYQNYTVTLTTGISDTQGNSPQQDTSWSFRTERTAKVKAFPFPGGTLGSLPQDLIVIDSTLFFTAEPDALYGDDSDTGRELYKSDGTAAGTSLVKDINPGKESSGIFDMTVHDGGLYFLADNDPVCDDWGWCNYNRKLWVSDGTAAGTRVIDISSNGGAYPYGLTSSGEFLFFRADTSGYGTELWISDGTDNGRTEPLKDINTSGSSSPTALIDFNGTLFFQADDGTGSELWASDGSADNTKKFKDLSPDGYSQFSYMTVSGGKLFFRHYNSVSMDSELGVSDGTPSGTFIIDIDNESGSSPYHLTDINGVLFFRAYHSTYGYELWRSDGTEIGTMMVKDLAPNTGSTYFNHLTNINGTLYFAIGSQLWKSNGNPIDPNGTVMVKEFKDESDDEYIEAIISKMTAFDEELYISVQYCYYGDCYYDVERVELWKSQGTEATTTVVKDDFSFEMDCDDYYGDCYPIILDDFNEFNNMLFYQATGDNSGSELWSTDADTETTEMAVNINQFPDSQKPIYLTDVAGALFFQCCSGTNKTELWKSDLSHVDPDGTLLVKDLTIPDRSYPYNLYSRVSFNGSFFFVYDDLENGTELWKSNGDPDDPLGTTLFKDINVGPGSSSPSNFTVAGSTLLFTANDGTYGTELWRTNGSPGFTSRIADIYPGSGSSYISYMTFLYPYVYFRSNDNSRGYELWRFNTSSSPSSSNPGIVMDINTSTVGASSNPEYLTNVNGDLYFTADNGINGRELWISGSASGTKIVEDLTDDASSSSIYYITAVGDKAYFRHYARPDYDYELGVSDGTPAGTDIMDLNPDGSSSPYNLTDVDGVLFLSARDNNNDTELYKVSGGFYTLVKNINETVNQNGDPISSNPQNLLNIGGTLYFTADDGIHGMEVWQSDGSPGGTKMVKDINPGSGGSGPAYLTKVGNALVFIAYDRINGFSIWKHVPGQ